MADIPDNHGRNSGLILQKHGGALLPGGPGRGAGRKPSRIRDALRLSFEKRYKVWESIADDQKLHPGERSRAVEMLAKYGLGLLQGVSEDDVRKRLKATCDMLHEVLPDPEATLVVSRMRKIWT